jgi:hypothetical protein
MYECFCFVVINNMFQQCYILFPFLSADLVIVATVPLAFEADICMIY